MSLVDWRSFVRSFARFHIFSFASQLDWTTLTASLGSIALATFSKEQGLTSLAICVLYELVYNQKVINRCALYLSLPLSLSM